MANFGCPACGETVQTGWKTCPKCGASLAGLTKTPAARKVGGLTIIVGLFAVLAVLAGIASLVMPKAESMKASAAVRGEATLRVTNENDAGWFNLMLTLNDTYRHRVENIPPGSDLELPLINFAAADGRRFLPATTKVVKLRIEATFRDRPSSVSLSFQ